MPKLERTMKKLDTCARLPCNKASSFLPQKGYERKTGHQYRQQQQQLPYKC